MSERERGCSFPDSLEQMEKRRVGKYLTWRGWRHQLEEELGISFTNSFSPEAERLLHKFYVLRRVQQTQGAIDKEKTIAFWEEAEQKLSGFERDYDLHLQFIMKKTAISQSGEKTRRS